ncbi:MAG: aldo/keto reductase [Candidatus Competibacteraceae bacterium]
MKSLAVAERTRLRRYVAHQAYYSLVEPGIRVGIDAAGPRSGRRFAWSGPAGMGTAHRPHPPRQPLAHDQPLAEFRRHQRGSQVSEEYLFKVVDALDEVAAETGKTIPQIALNWLLGRPSIATVIIGARDERQLRDNLGAVGWSLTAEQVAKLDQASAVPRIYPYWHQAGFSERNPFPTGA